MTIKELCSEIAEIMEIDQDLTQGTDLRQFEEFDSLAIMSIVALVNMKFGKKLPGTELQKISSVNDLVQMIGEEAFTK